MSRVDDRAAKAAEAAAPVRKLQLFSLGKAVDLLRGGTGSKADGTQSTYSQNGLRP